MVKIFFFSRFWFIKRPNGAILIFSMLSTYHHMLGCHINVLSKPTYSVAC